MAPYYSTIIGTDIDNKAINKANEMNKFNNCSFVVADGMNLPFDNDMFDIIICNHIYEHVPDDKSLIKEINRVLKPNGICYFGGGHKYQIIEPHYRLPFFYHGFLIN